jgi:hypothetical protein
MGRRPRRSEMMRIVSTLVDPVETMGLEPTTFCLQSRLEAVRVVSARAAQYG